MIRSTPEQLGIREHDAGVDDDRRVAPGEGEHVHAELAQAAERNHFEHLKREYRPGPNRLQAERLRHREPRRGSSGCWARLNH